MRKNWLKNSHPFKKNVRKLQGGFFDSHCSCRWNCFIAGMWDVAKMFGSGGTPLWSRVHGVHSSVGVSLSQVTSPWFWFSVAHHSWLMLESFAPLENPFIIVGQCSKLASGEEQCCLQILYKHAKCNRILHPLLLYYHAHRLEDRHKCRPKHNPNNDVVGDNVKTLITSVSQLTVLPQIV